MNSKVAGVGVKVGAGVVVASGVGLIPIVGEQEDRTKINSKATTAGMFSFMDTPKVNSIMVKLYYWLTF
jgi:hypothetical protein